MDQGRVRPSEKLQDVGIHHGILLGFDRKLHTDPIRVSHDLGGRTLRRMRQHGLEDIGQFVCDPSQLVDQDGGAHEGGVQSLGVGMSKTDLLIGIGVYDYGNLGVQVSQYFLHGKGDRRRERLLDCSIHHCLEKGSLLTHTCHESFLNRLVNHLEIQVLLENEIRSCRSQLDDVERFRFAT